eukprot:15467240-Alexandrium_andersonii.AAC.1
MDNGRIRGTPSHLQLKSGQVVVFRRSGGRLSSSPAPGGQSTKKIGETPTFRRPRLGLRMAGATSNKPCPS